MALFVATAVVIVAVFVMRAREQAGIAVRDAEETLSASQARLMENARTRTTEWVENILVETVKAADNDVLREFMQSAPFSRNPLADANAPEAEKVVKRLAETLDALGTSVLSSSGLLLMGTGTVVTDDIPVNRCMIDRKPVFGDIHDFGGNFYVPVAVPAFDGKTERGIAGVLFTWIPLEGIFASVLEIPMPKGTEAMILFTDSDGNREMAILEKDAAKTIRYPWGTPPKPGERIPGDALTGIWKLPSLSWTFMTRTSPDIVTEMASAGTRDAWFFNMSIGIPLAALVLIGGALLVVWAGKNQKSHVASLDEEAMRKTALLDAMSESMGAGIVLCDRKGQVLMANGNFMKTFAPDGISGKTLAMLLPDSGALLPALDMSARTGERKQMEWEREGAFYRVSFAPFVTRDGTGGSVAVFDDITSWRRKEKLERERLDSVTDTFARAVESVDPGSLGQSAELARIATACKDSIAADDTRLVELSAKLSQVGKILVPRDIFTKRDLTEKDREELAKIPEHAGEILDGLLLDIPVRETVAEMGKRFDEHPEMSRAARLLSVANAVAAMTKPRKWRNGIPVAEAVMVLSCDQAFDMEMLAEIARVTEDDQQ